MIGKEGVESPVEIKADAQTQTDSYVRLEAGPWENGYGHTIGNALRRVLLSSMEGVAVTSIKIDDVQHEFTSIKGVVEDVMDIVLNIKKLKFNCVGQLPRTIELKADRKGPVTAACIVEDPVVEVLNKDQLICTLDIDRPFRIEMNIDRGRGFRKSEDSASPRTTRRKTSHLVQFQWTVSSALWNQCATTFSPHVSASTPTMTSWKWKSRQTAGFSHWRP